MAFVSNCFALFSRHTHTQTHKIPLPPQSLFVTCASVLCRSREFDQYAHLHILHTVMFTIEMHINRNFYSRTFKHSWMNLAKRKADKCFRARFQLQKATYELIEWENSMLRHLNVSRTKQWLWVVNLFAVVVVFCEKNTERERESEIYTQRLNIYFGGRDQGIRLAKWSHLRCVDDSNRAGGRER